MSTSASAPLTPERIYQYVFGYSVPLVIEAALKYRVFDVLHDGPKTIAEVHAATGASERGLRAIMNVLVGFQFLAVNKEGSYSLTPESAAFLVSTKPAFQGGLFRLCSEHFLPRWIQLNEAVASGQPAAAVNDQGPGTEFFEKLVNEIFPMSYLPAQELADHLDLRSATAPVRVLDLAAGSGVWGIALAQSSQHVHVTAVDWHGVVPVTQKTVARFGLSDRFSFIEGDILEAEFGTGHNVATLGHILHSEGVERSKKLLGRTFEALAPGGTIAIQEFLVNKERTGPPHGLVFAVNMLVFTDVGDTFSFEEIAAWLGDAGFVNARTVNTHGQSPLILATKPSANPADGLIDIEVGFAPLVPAEFVEIPIEDWVDHPSTGKH